MSSGDSSPAVQAPVYTQASLAAGAFSGLAGLLVFLVAHHIWILPIWFILPFGLLIAIPGGLAAGWACSEVGQRLPPRPWTVFAFTALIAVTLLPATVLAESRSPMFVLSAAGPVFQMTVSKAAIVFIAELLLSASLSGGLLGWWLGGTRKAALAMALAGLVFALAPGHNIPFIGGIGGFGRSGPSWGCSFSA